MVVESINKHFLSLITNINVLVELKNNSQHTEMKEKNKKGKVTEKMELSFVSPQSANMLSLFGTEHVCNLGQATKQSKHQFLSGLLDHPPEIL